jgi:hypothetical protein
MGNTGIEVTKTLYTPEDIARNADYWEFGIDPGSGFAIAYGTPVKIRVEGRQEIKERGNTYTLVIPSQIGTISLDELVAGRALQEGAKPATVLESEEYILRLPTSKTDKVVGKWAEIEGKNTTAAKGLAERYWGQHGLELTLTLISAITQAPKVSIRLITGLPWSLYEVPGNRTRVIQNLEGTHHYKFNGEERECSILVGAIVAEGYAPIAYADELDDDQLSVDIGERTVNALYTHNLTILYDRCRSEMFGIGNTNDAIIHRIKRDYHKEIKLSVVRDYLTKFATGAYLPPLKTGKKMLEDRDLKAIYEDQINTDWIPIQTMMGTLLNVEGAEVGSNIRRLFLSGGGAAIYHTRFQSYLPSTNIILVEQSQEKNAEYYHDLAKTIERSKPNAWKR